MQLLKEMIINRGKVLSPSILKVDTFLNHQMDPALINEMGKEFSAYFGGRGITKILTIEASGIAIALMTGLHMGVPVVFAKKHEALNLENEVYTASVFSHTKNREYTIKVEKKLIGKDDKMLIIDDFLANGRAALGLVQIVESAGASVIGLGIAIEKAFQAGGALLRKRGYDVYSLAVVKSMEGGEVEFR